MSDGVFRLCQGKFIIPPNSRQRQDRCFLLKVGVNPQLNSSFSNPQFLKHSISIYAYTYMDESLPGRSRAIWFACLASCFGQPRQVYPPKAESSIHSPINYSPINYFSLCLFVAKTNPRNLCNPWLPFLRPNQNSPAVDLSKAGLPAALFGGLARRSFWRACPPSSWRVKRQCLPAICVAG
jgi:hypothetical protein